MRWAWRAASTSAPSCRTRCGAGGVCLVRTFRALVLPSLARPPAAVSRAATLRGGPGASPPLTPVPGGAAVGRMWAAKALESGSALVCRSPASGVPRAGGALVVV